MRIRAKRFRLFALATVLALVLAACGDGRGDDDDDAGGSGGDSTTQTTAAGEEGEEEGSGGAFEIDTANCITDPETVEVTGDTLKIGTSLPQSGIYAAFAEILRGEQAYIQYVNEEKGGFDFAGKKVKVELVALDDAYAAEQTVANANTLINDEQVFALFNVVGTKNNLAIRDLVNENCVPNLFAATGSPAWGNPNYPWLLGTYLVPYPLEMQALKEYLVENMPQATIAILRAADDFGAAYADTLKSLIEGTDLKIVAEQTYDPETGEVNAQMTSLASSNADVFVLGATLLACPVSLNQLGAAGWAPLVYMSGTCTSKTLMNAAGANADKVLSVAPLMDPNDPQYASSEAMTLYKEKVAQYQPEADAGNGIVAYGWSTGALLEKLLATAEAPNRLALMQAARTLSDVTEVGLQLPGATWSVDADDWFLGEMFNLVQYSVADGFFKPVGDLHDASGQTAEITPPNLING